MPVVTQQWIESFDALVQGRQLAESVRAELNSTLRAMGKVETKYAALMRSTTETEQVQQEAKETAQTEIYKLEQEMISIRTKMQTISDSIDNELAPLIAVLLADYVPPTPEAPPEE